MRLFWSVFYLHLQSFLAYVVELRGGMGCVCVCQCQSRVSLCRGKGKGEGG